MEGAVFEKGSPRLVTVDGIGVEAPLEGTMIVVSNRDEPGVIGEIGTILGKHGVNIANFALGRNDGHAVGVVIVDETAPIPEVVLAELRRAKAIAVSATGPCLIAAASSAVPSLDSRVTESSVIDITR